MENSMQRISLLCALLICVAPVYANNKSGEPLNVKENESIFILGI